MQRRSLPILALLLAACSAAPSPSSAPLSVEPPSSAGEPRAQVTEGGFTLTLAAEPSRVAAGEVIRVAATIAHDRQAAVHVFGSGSGIVYFSVTRIEDGLTSGAPVHTDDCAEHVLPAGESTPIPFSKSGGYSPGDPNADFLEIYFAEPELTLPAGTWRIDAESYGWLGEGCSGETLDLATSVEVTVTD